MFAALNYESPFRPTPMTIYLLQSSVVLSVLYLLYRLTLRRETLHGLSVFFVVVCF